MKVVHLMMPANKFAEAVEFYVEGLGLKSDRPARSCLW
jgi:catechol 2,3-dioxygenase-like lactoylglutathione lyase family enzyme